MRFSISIFALFILLTQTACTSNKTAAAYKPTGVSLSMMKLLTGSWETVGINLSGRTLVLSPKETTEFTFKNDKMLLRTLGKSETTTYAVKDKMIVNPYKLTERPMRIVYISRTELGLSFTATDGAPVEMTLLRKN